MRTIVPAAFSQRFSGPEGPYTIGFEPADAWDGIINVTIAGHTMRWHVLVSDQEADGGVVLSGMTGGSKPLWNDQFWFELRFTDAPPLIRYWGDQVVWREDRAA